jgi:hypothetical protein
VKGIILVISPAVKSNRGPQFKFGLGEQFYVGWAHQYIRTKGICISGPGQYRIGQGEQSFIGRLWPTLLRGGGVVTNTTPLAVTVPEKIWAKASKPLLKNMGMHGGAPIPCYPFVNLKYLNSFLSSAWPQTYSTGHSGWQLDIQTDVPITVWLWPLEVYQRWASYANRSVV